MNDKEKIIKFLEMKNEIIKKESKINYIDKEDIEDVKSWSNKKCKTIYQYITDQIHIKKVYGIGFSTCPWCILCNIYKVKGCTDCGYGERHGECGYGDSLYDLYRSVYLIENVLTNKVYKNILKTIEDSK